MLIALDGTWDGAQSGTNVRKFFDAYAPSPHNLYLEGVGANVSWLGHLAGGIFGAGERCKVKAAFEHIQAHIADDPVIDIVGFSRGSATALDLANKIHKHTSYTIRFLGLWDVVAAFGVANLGFYFSRLTFGHRIYLPPDRVLYACHAMALDERRPSFVVTRVNGAHEVWFKGVHGDVGGGRALGLSNIALEWMCHKAAAAGVPIDVPNLVTNPATFPSFDFEQRASSFRRTVLPTDLLHHTVECSLANPVETPFDELSISLSPAGV